MKTVLIVDDEQLFLASLTEGLVSYSNDFEVLTANNGLQALDIISSRAIDLLVTDLKMPVMDGFQLLAHLINGNFNLPVIVMTAFGTPEIEERLRSLQTISYLEKPIDLQKLATAINEGLSQNNGVEITEISLSNFLRLVCLERKTCLLEVRSAAGQGALFLSQGELFQARSGPLEGEPAALEILTWQGVTIEFKPLFKKIKRRIQRPLLSILSEAENPLTEVVSTFGQEETALPLNQPPAAETEAILPELELPRVIQPASTPEPLLPSTAKVKDQPITRKDLELDMMNNVNQSLEALMNIDGAKAVALVDANSGMSLGSAGGGINLDVAAAGNSEVIKAKYKTMNNLGLKDKIEDVLISLGEQYHLIRPLKDHTHLFFYLVLNRASANLAMARFKLSDVEGRVQV